MGVSEIYHFHKDCKHYEKCTEEIVIQGKRKRIKFICPQLKYPQLYYIKDLHTIKWDCPLFEPKEKREEKDLKKLIKDKAKSIKE